MGCGAVSSEAPSRSPASLWRVLRREARAATPPRERLGVHPARRARRSRRARLPLSERRGDGRERDPLEPLRRCRRCGVLDSAGGFVLGAAAGAAIVWVAGAVALHVPGQVQLREEVQQSRILGELNAHVPPSRLLDAIARVDPFSAILGPVPRVAPPDPALLNSAGVRLASPSVFRDHRDGVRARDRRLRLGRCAEPHRHERARRRGDEGRARRPQRRRFPRRRRRRLRSPQRHRRASRRRARRAAAPSGRPGQGTGRGDPRLPGERPVHGGGRSDRPDPRVPHRRRVRPRSVPAARHDAARCCPARQLGRPRG